VKKTQNKGHYPTALTSTNDHLTVLRHYVLLNAKLCSI